MSNFTAPQSQQIVATVRDIIINYLSTKLNDSGGPYQPVLNAAITVTPSEEVAGELYKDGVAGVPWVLVLLERHLSQFHYTTNSGQVSGGHRHQIDFLLDMSMSDQAAAATNPAEPAILDRKLCDAVCSIIDSGYADLIAQGLEEDVVIRAAPESQKSSSRRNPHTLTVVAYTVD